MQNNSISLFSGALGLDLGLERAGFVLRLALEKDKRAVETIRLNRQTLPVIQKSISETSSEEILKSAVLTADEVTLISAGPCCQSFSTVGKRRSLTDPRGGLFKDFCRVVREIRPRFFVMENVRGMLSAAIRHRPLDERGPGFPPLAEDEQFGSGLEVIRKALSDLRYYVVFGLLNAADYGVPQKRWRVFFIGSRDGEALRLPKPTHCAPALCQQMGLPEWLDLRAGVQGVVSKHKHWIDFSDDRLGLLARLKPGQNWRDLPKGLRRRALGAAADSWGGRVGFCRRLSWDEPAPTLTTAPDGRATTLCHPSELRPLSIEEYAALQQFPSTWKFSGSIHQQYAQIGNAVPVELGAAVGRAIQDTIAETSANGLPPDAKTRLGRVVCIDEALAHRLKNRRITQLHPRRLRKNKDTEKARRWLLVSERQIAFDFSKVQPMDGEGGQ